MSRELDIAIIGAGLSGLAAAIQCALSGHYVTVLEGARELAEVRCSILSQKAMKLICLDWCWSAIDTECNEIASGLGCL